MKRILVIFYSQSGQLEDIARSIALPFLEAKDVIVDYYEIETVRSFPFPWTADVFFDVFPETFQQIPNEIKPPSTAILESNYDLVILHFQVWFLTPSIPINSFLKSPFARSILQGRPVVTVSGSRNMWAKAQDKVKALIEDNEGSLVGNIALTDRHGNWISVITIVDWMFSGVKRKAFGIFPMPGVATSEIQGAKKYGSVILSFLREGSYKGLQHALVEKGAVKFKFFLISMDQKGNRMFRIWSKIILNNPKKRKLLVSMFQYYVVFAIYFLSPIVFLVEILLFPMLYFIRIRKDKKHYLGV